LRAGLFLTLHQRFQMPKIMYHYGFLFKMKQMVWAFDPV
jgi:hypothetical protein